MGRADKRALAKQVKKIIHSSTDKEFRKFREQEALIRKIREYSGSHPYLTFLSRQITTKPNWIPTAKQLALARNIMAKNEYEHLPDALE